MPSEWTLCLPPQCASDSPLPLLQWWQRNIEQEFPITANYRVTSTRQSQFASDFFHSLSPCRAHELFGYTICDPIVKSSSQIGTKARRELRRKLLKCGGWRKWQSEIQHAARIRVSFVSSFIQLHWHSHQQDSRELTLKLASSSALSLSNE